LRPTAEQGIVVANAELDQPGGAVIVANGIVLGITEPLQSGKFNLLGLVVLMFNNKICKVYY
jgi:hypothetical protein